MTQMDAGGRDKEGIMEEGMEEGLSEKGRKREREDRRKVVIVV